MDSVRRMARENFCLLDNRREILSDVFIAHKVIGFGATAGLGVSSIFFVLLRFARADTICCPVGATKLWLIMDVGGSLAARLSHVVDLWMGLGAVLDDAEGTIGGGGGGGGGGVAELLGTEMSIISGVTCICATTSSGTEADGWSSSSEDEWANKFESCELLYDLLVEFCIWSGGWGDSGRSCCAWDCEFLHVLGENMLFCRLFMILF